MKKGPTLQQQLAAARLLLDGRDAAFVRSAAGLSAADVAELADQTESELGMTIAYLERRIERGNAIPERTDSLPVRQAMRETAIAAPVPPTETEPELETERESEPMPVTEIEVEVPEPEVDADFRELVRRAGRSEHKRTRALGWRIAELAADLRQRLEVEDEETRVKEQAERERTEAQARLDAALAEVEAAKEALRAAKGVTVPKAAKASKPNTPASDSGGVGAAERAAIREWAKVNGIGVGGKGRIAASVVDAYREAHQGSAA